MFNRVLIADDHALVREGIGILISRGGFTVVAEASNGQEALAHASSYQPDIAVLDMSMPIMNGLETAQEMRKLSPRTRSICCRGMPEGIRPRRDACRHQGVCAEVAVGRRTAAGIERRVGRRLLSEPRRLGSCGRRRSVAVDYTFRRPTQRARASGYSNSSPRATRPRSAQRSLASVSRPRTLTARG